MLRQAHHLAAQLADITGTPVEVRIAGRFVCIVLPREAVFDDRQETQV